MPINPKKDVPKAEKVYKRRKLAELREAVRKKLKERKEAARKEAKESEAAKAKTASEAGNTKKARIHLRIDEKRFILAFVQALVKNGLEQKDAIAELHKAFKGLYKHVTASSLYDFTVGVRSAKKSIFRPAPKT